MAVSLGKRPEVGQDGIVDLPPGKIAAVATYLEMDPPPEARPIPPHRGTFERIGHDLRRYRTLYKAVGEPWLWFSRARLSDLRLRAILEDSRVEPLAFQAGGRDLGLIELDFRIADQCELSFLGLIPEAIGQGLGRVLIEEAIRRAFARPIARLWLHTCTLDHPAALPFYMAAGLRPFRRAIEIAEDPRLTGELPREAAPHLPIV